MIGFYDYTVILTYISFASSISGIFLATRGHFNWAIFCLAFSGLCDMFDGKIARTKKNRTEDEKRFGIQIDSLCDVVCFGVFPIVLCYELGMTRSVRMKLRRTGNITRDCRLPRCQWLCRCCSSLRRSAADTF